MFSSLTTSANGRMAIQATEKCDPMLSQKSAAGISTTRKSSAPRRHALERGTDDDITIAEHKSVPSRTVATFDLYRTSGARMGNFSRQLIFSNVGTSKNALVAESSRFT